MNRFEKIAAQVVAQVADERAFGEITSKLESMRQGYKLDSDEGIFLGIIRDMAVHIRRGNLGAIDRLAKEMVAELKNVAVSHIASRVAVKFDTKNELQDYKREHHPKPGTKLQVRNEQEMKQRNKDREASKSRYCFFYKTRSGNWYMELAEREYADRDDATTYGPFPSKEKAMDYLDRFSNPGAMTTDDSGTEPEPHKSPNGYPVEAPRGRWGSSKAAAHNAVYVSDRDVRALVEKMVNPRERNQLRLVDKDTGLPDDSTFYFETDVTDSEGNTFVTKIDVNISVQGEYR